MKTLFCTTLIVICVLSTNAQPAPITLASGLSISSKIMVDSAAIYWAEDDNTVPYYNDATTGIIRKVGKNGGTVTTLASGLNHPSGVLLDASNIYFIERGSWPNSNGTIKRVPKNGGTITILASGLDYPQGAGTIEAADVYFADPCNVNKVGINGGPVTTIATDVCWGPGAVTVDHSGSLYCILVSGLTSTGGLKKVSVNGGPVTTLATVSTGSNDIALDASYVYWTVQGTPPYGYPVAGNGVLRKVSKNGGTVTTLASGLNAPQGIAFDSASGYVYWIEAGTWSDGVYNANTGSIKKIPVSGGTITTLASGLNAPSTIQVDGTNIYYSETPNSGGGSIKKMGEGPVPFLRFPLPNFNSYDAPIVSVFDHSGPRYCPNDTVEDFADEIATVPDLNEPPAKYSCGYLYSYKKPDGTAFLSSVANYVGTLGTGLTTLNYDGHPGYDYRVPIGTTVFAAASGAVIVAHNVDDDASGKWVRILHDNGYLTQYLHLNDINVSVGQNINAGSSIGHSGNTGGVAPHLHFEVKKIVGSDSVSFDPYGWQGIGTDPYTALTGIVNVKLWIDNPLTANFWQQTNGPDTLETTSVSALAFSSAGQLFASTTRGCLESDALGVFRSTNNGTSWAETNSGLSNANVGSLTVTPAGHFLAGTQNGIFRSTDNGSSWSYVGLAGVYITFLFSTPNAIFASDGCFCSGIYRSTDDGTSWIPINSGLDDGCINALSLSNQGYLFAGSGVSGIYRSTENGDSWDKKNSGLLSPNIISIVTGPGGELYAGTQTNVYTGQSGAGVFRSTDNGESWQQATSGLPTDEISHLAVNSIGYVFAATSRQGVYSSTDKGNSWEPVGPGLEENSTVSAFAFNNSGYVFAAAGGIVYRSVQPVTYVQYTSETFPSSYVLRQNYPNPFNPSTTIEFALPKSAYVTLRVYDLLGRQVGELVNEKLEPGMYKTQWNASGLASGVYFYRLQAGEFTETKKLLLLR